MQSLLTFPLRRNSKTRLFFLPYFSHFFWEHVASDLVNSFAKEFTVCVREREREVAMVSYKSLLIYGVGGIAVAGMALLVAFQEKLVYVPVLPGLTKSYPITPDRLRLIFEDVWLTSSDGVRLHSWFIKFSPNSTGHHLYLSIYKHAYINSHMWSTFPLCITSVQIVEIRLCWWI